MHAINALPQRTVPQYLSFNDFLTTHGMDKVKQIVDSYDTMAARNGKAIAAEQIRKFFDISPDILNSAINYVSGNEGRIIPLDQYERPKKEGRIIPLDEQRKDLEAEVRKGHTSTVTPIEAAKNYGVPRQAEYVKPTDVIPITRTRTYPVSTNQAGIRIPKPSRSYRRWGAITAASLAALTYFANPFSGLMGRTNITNIEIRPAYANGPTVDDHRKYLEFVRGKVKEALEKGQAPAQKGVAPAQGPAPVAPVVPVTQAPGPAPSPATPVVQATPPVSPQPTLQDLVKDHSKVKWSYNQAEEQHAKYIKGEVKYADLFDRIKAWFSLKTPKSQLKQDGEKYGIEINQLTSYKQADLSDFYVGVKVAGKWHYAQRPNADFLVGLTKQEHDALKGATNRVGQVIFYKIEEKDGKPLVKIFASLNYEKKPKKPVDELPPRADKVEAPPAPKAAEVPTPKVVSPAVTEDVGGVPYETKHRTH